MREIKTSTFTPSGASGFSLEKDEVAVYNAILDDELNPTIEGDKFENVRLEGNILTNQATDGVSNYALGFIRKGFDDARSDYNELICGRGSRMLEFGERDIPKDLYAEVYTAMMSYYIQKGKNGAELTIDNETKGIVFGYADDDVSSRSFLRMIFPEEFNKDQLYTDVSGIRDRVVEAFRA